MRLKRARTARKTTLFYRMNFNIQEPYHVLGFFLILNCFYFFCLVDPKFLQIALTKRLGLKENLPKVIQAKAFPSLTFFL